MTAIFVYVFILGIFGAVPSESRPADDVSRKLGTAKLTSNVPSAKLFDFMKQYGYIETGPGDAEALYTEEGLSEKIKTLQRFGGLPETGVIDNATVALITKRRCGVADITKNRKKRFSPVSSWKKRDITYHIANWSPKLSRDIVKKNIQLALDTWGRYGQLRFYESQHRDADIIVAFSSGYHGDDYPFDGPGNVLAHAFYPAESRFGGDVHFDEDEDWKESYDLQQEGTHFYSVALHELGHSLGLAHSAVPTSVMFPYYKGGDEGLALDYDDILGIYELYIKNSRNEVPTAPARSEEDKSRNNYPYDPRTESSREDYDPRKDSSKERENNSHNNSEEDHYNGSGERYGGSSEQDKRYGYSTQRPHTDHTVNYEGDTATIDEHNDKLAGVPDICQGNFDAAATLRGELFIFKNQYIWRLREKNRIMPGYPITIRNMFPGLPKTVRKIDAAYQRLDGNIVLFTGKKFWVFNGSRFIENSPRPLTDYSLPKWLDSVDAVHIWGKNDKTYFYSRDHFWRYNETSKTMDPGYPMHVERWRGIPEDIDAATTWTDGITYFFKGKQFWKFDNVWVKTSESSPLPTPQLWLGCPKEEE